ncbi:hypothetical protein R8Z50_10435 [Longispora sp. K20-0274]|uniref:hypothetical protein n=1 Tax=Longispora sp. K20-0274 TaxID=3088255 RepID=UPI00399B2C4E
MTQPVAKDNSKTLGIVGILLSWCIVGLVCSIMSIMAAKKNNSSPTLGYVGVGLTVLWVIVIVILQVAVLGAATATTP